MLFHKFQALGNDFVIVRESALRAISDDFGVFSKQICDRHFGAGADGVEVLLDSPRAAGVDFEVRLFNADGGESPISGNGTRCVAAYLYLVEKWGGPEVRIATGAGLKILKPVDRGDLIGPRMVFEAEMGAPRFASEEIPVVMATRLDRASNSPQRQWAIRIAVSSWTISRALIGALSARRSKLMRPSPNERTSNSYG
jgi:diaminopimelate epimerase